MGMDGGENGKDREARRERGGEGRRGELYRWNLGNYVGMDRKGSYKED